MADLTFNDLRFNPSQVGMFARLPLPSGVILSVISGPHTYSDAGSYEVAAIGVDGALLRLGEFDDVLAYQSQADINALIQKLS